MSRRRRFISVRAMWLLHALSSPVGARAFHLREYGPKLDDLRRDLKSLVDADCIMHVKFVGDDRFIECSFTQRGRAWLAAWRGEVLSVLDTQTCPKGEKC